MAAKPVPKAQSVEQRFNVYLAGGYDPVAGPPTLETWHSLGSLTGYTVTVGRYKLDRSGLLVVDIEVQNNTGTNSVNFANTMPSAYRPVNNRHFPIGQTGTVGSTSNQWPRVLIGTDGSVGVYSPASSGFQLGCTIYCPLD